MNLRPSDEEAQLQDTMRRFARGHDDVGAGDVAERYEQSWRAFAALGGTGMAVGEDQGGFGFSSEGVALAAFELGAMPRAMPRIEQVVAVARLLESAQNADAATLRASFVAGETHVVLADWEGEGQHGFASPATRVERGSRGLRLFGTKAAVIGAVRADVALVTARLDGANGLFAVPLANVQRMSHGLVDGTPVADLTLGDVCITDEPLLLGAPFDAAWDRARDEAIVMAAAAASGSMTAAIRQTIDYLKVRRQFGAALADFQALQQRVADLFIGANEARSSVYAALAALHDAPERRRRAASGCKVKVAHVARHVTGELMHLHGGIGFTVEYSVGHHHRRASVDEQLFGDPDFHLDRYLHIANDVADSDAKPRPMSATLARVTASG